MIPVILEAAFRSLLMAVAVWAGIRMMRVQAVLAQKLAWVLVLLAAGTMPLVMRAPIPVGRAVEIPASSMFRSELQKAAVAARPVIDELQWALWMSQPLGARTAGGTLPMAATSTKPVVYLKKPSAAHPLSRSSKSSELTSARSGWKIDGAVPLTDAETLVASTARSVLPSQPASSSIGSWLRTRATALITFLYCAIAAFLLLRTLAGLAVALRLWLRSKPVADIAMPVLTGEPARAKSVRVSRDLVTPVTIGSAVILPANYAEWDEAKLRIVLAHEQSHVRQGDFYLQLFAAVHVAVFWFSPLGWWLKRKLSELGEALSDRAGLEEAPDASTYAQVLLEFAAMPRTSPVAGVAIARSNSISSRIDRILNVSRFRPAFMGGRRHAFLAASLVIAALVAVVACIRIVPTVDAAQAQPSATAKPLPGSTSGALCTGRVRPADAQSGEASSDSSEDLTGQVATGDPEPVTAELVKDGTDAAPAPSAMTITGPQVAPIAPPSPLAPPADVTVTTPLISAAPAAPLTLVAPHSGDTLSLVAPMPPMPAQAPGSFAYGYSGDDDEDSFAIIRGNGNVTLSGHAGKALETAKRKYHNNFIWFERDGKSYVVTDPSILGQFNGYYARNQDLQREQARLQNQQDELSQRMKEFDPSKARLMLNSPEMKKQMAELNAKLAELQSEKFKKMTEDLNKQVNQEVLSDLQNKMGQIQSEIGEMQGRIGEEMGRLGEKQGELGEQMGRLGEQMGHIGEEQGRIGEEMNQKIQSIIDRAIQNGTAKPVE